MLGFGLKQNRTKVFVDLFDKRINCKNFEIIR